MTAIDHITPKLQRLLLLLSSNRPGEVVAAAAAIDRTLRAAGCDWHDLAAGILTPSATEQPESTDWRAIRAFCLKHQTLLRSREVDFITSLGNWRGSLTEKQRT
jgi:hypothetical protein